jgi:hypothetical protein
MPKEYDSLYKSAQFFINKIFDTAEGGTPWNETRFIFLEETAEQTKHTKLQGLVDAMRAYQTSKVSVMHMTKKDAPDIEAALQFDIIQPAVQRQVNLVLISYFDETSLIDDLLWNLRQRYINRSKGHATALMWHSVTVKIFRLIDDTHNINYQQKIEELSNILYSNFMLDQPDIADKYFPNCSVTHFFRETDNITSRKLFLAGCVGQKNDLLRAKDMSKDIFNEGIKYEIFVGIKDKDSYIEVLSVEDFRDILTEICTEKQISFTMLTQHGGYTHGKGYTTETSLRVVIIGITEDEVELLSQKLKRKINTDAVLITKTEIEYCYI